MQGVGSSLNNAWIMYMYFTVYTFYWGHSFLHIATGQPPTVLKIIASEMLFYLRHAFVLVVNGHSIKAVVQVYMYMCSSCMCVACVVAYTDHCARSMLASLL